jgi:predicted nucleic acid-binding protein
MAQPDPIRPRVFVDADVLFAGAASPSEYSASLVVLRLAEITLIEAITSEQVITEAERNLAAKIPAALPAFRLLVSRCLRRVPTPTADERHQYAGLADSKDLSILVAALQADCPWLLTFNTRHFQPGHPDVTVLSPGEFVQRIRHLLAHLM